MRGIRHISLICLLSIAVGGVCRASEPVDTTFLQLAQYLSRGDASMMPCSGNVVDIIDTGTRKWELLVADLEAARHTICMEYYRWRQDEAGDQIRDIILRKLAQGVQVKILLEDLSNPFYRKDYYLELRDAGAQLQFFTDFDHQIWEMIPGINYRNHRKIVIIDECIGYIGGMNLGVTNRDLWGDMHLRVTGPAVASLNKLFYDMWDARKGPFLKRQEARMAAMGDGIPADSDSTADAGFRPVAEEAAALPDTTQFQPSASHLEFRDKTVQVATGGAGDNLLEGGVCRLLASATKYVYIQTPYYCPTDTVFDALKSAARRGVDVCILISEESDSKLMTVANSAFYEESVAAGVRILLSPGRFFHSKSIVADDYLSIIGSLNLDPRSLVINHEAIALIYDAEVAAACRELFCSRAEGAREVTLEELESASRREKNRRHFWRRNSGQL